MSGDDRSDGARVLQFPSTACGDGGARVGAERRRLIDSARSAQRAARIWRVVALVQAVALSAVGVWYLLERSGGVR